MATETMPRRDTKKQREAFAKVRNAENYYRSQLRKVARHINDIVMGYEHDDPAQLAQMQKVLRRYATIIKPWSRNVARRMLHDVSKRDERAWSSYAKNMGVEIRREIQETPIGAELRSLLADQVNLITSLPLQAAQRVHELTQKAIPEGGRYKNIVDEIKDTGQVTMSRATLIARTETARTASALTMVRAKSIGSEGYIWRTAHDADVRPSHKKMEGKFIRWDDPPEVDPGKRYHAGMFPNCRCVAEPIIPDTFE